MMTLEFLLQISVASLTVLGTSLMGMGERDPYLPAVAALVAVSSVFLTDYKGWFRLNATIANVTGLVAVVAALQHLRSFGSDAWLMAIAHLLSYLQFILLYQQKSNRHYWLLMMLSLLQVAVAAALNLEFWFGVLLIAYLLAGLLSLTLFFMLRELRRFESRELRSTEGESLADAILSGAPASRGSFTPGVYIDPSYGHVNFAFLRRLVGMLVFTLCLTAMLFYLMPRVDPDRGRWQYPRGASPQRLTGFSDGMSINDMGELLESKSPVLRLQLFEMPSNKPYPVVANVRLRGTVLTRYEDGQWKRDFLDSDELPPLNYKPPPEVEPYLVKQVIEIEPIQNPFLFAIGPFAPLERRYDVQIHTSYLHLIRSAQFRNTRFRYELVTWGIRDGRMLDQFPNYQVYEIPLRKPDELVAAPITPDQYRMLIRMPHREGVPQLGRLSALAQEIAPVLPVPDLQPDLDFWRRFRRSDLWTIFEQYQSIPSEEVRQRAKALEKFLRLDGGFRYSLRAEIKDASLDPIEDFLFNRKAGHCEYYASALTLMLRSLKIPARVVCGFTSPEWNPMGQFYQVRQCHAHSWVECYLPDGTWLQLDATPPEGRNEAIAQLDTGFPLMRQISDMVDYVWSGYVLGLDSKRQEEAVYSPIRHSISQMLDFVSRPSAWQEWWRETQAAWRRDGLYGVAQRFANRYVGGLLLLILSIAGLIAWRIRNRKRRRASAEVEAFDFVSPIPSETVHCFQRLEQVLARFQMIRAAGQTPRQFAREVARALADRAGCAGCAPIPRRIVEAYYRDRFGAIPLDAREQGILEHAVDELEAALEKPAADKSTVVKPAGA